MVVFTNTVAVAVVAALVALESSAMGLQEAISSGLPNQSLRGKSVRYPQKISESASVKFFKTKLGLSGVVEAEGRSQRNLGTRHDHHHVHDEILVNHEHTHIHRRDRHPHLPRHHHHHHDEHTHVHEREHEHHHHHDDEHVHIHDREHRHDHDDDHHHHHHDKRHRDHCYVNSYNNEPLLDLCLSFGLRDLHPRGLLDPVADLLAPVAPLLGTLVPCLAGLPLVGGIINIVSSALAGIGGDKIGALLAGKPMPVSAFVTNASYNPTSPIQSFAYQIDMSPSASGDSMFLAKLPFSLPRSPCTNATSIPVAIAYAKVANSTLQVLCLTYDSSPSMSAPITAQPCVNNTVDVSTMSQVFAFNEATNALQPLSNVTSSTPLGYTPGANVGHCAGSTVSTVTAGNTNGTAVNLIFGVTAPYTISTWSNGNASNITSANSTTTDATYTNSTMTSNSTSTIGDDDDMVNADDDSE